MDYSYGLAKKNIYYVHFPSPIRSGLFNYILLFFQKTNFPFVNTQGKYSLFSNRLKEKINDRLRAGIYIDMQKRLQSYQTIIANSSFTKQWIQKYWKKEAKVLYPPIQLLTTNDLRLTTKYNWICSLGRFFTLGHGKKQEVMIEAFKKLYDSLKSKPQTLNPKQIPNSKLQISNNQSPISNLQLHLIGGVGSEPSSLRFIDKLKHLAQGYPIFFHLNVPRKEVENILFKSKIYWHAAGYGEDPNKDPIKFEHFGIAPVEAISAGCIPVLFDGGGLREIIMKLGLDIKTHLFTSQKTLIQNTLKIMGGSVDLDWKTINSRLHQYFSSTLFKDRFTHTINEKN